MRKTILALAALSATSGAHAATMLNWQPGTGALLAGQTIIQNFESFAAGASIGSNATVYADSVYSVAARPAYGSTGKFAAISAGSSAPGSYEIGFGPTSVFSFALGSLDTFNKLTLRYADGSSQAYMGGQIVNDLIFPSGDQISGETNGRINYTVTSGPLLVGALFESFGTSFEFDNLAVAAPVPEPTTWALLMLGFFTIGRSLRGRRRATVASFS